MAGSWEIKQQVLAVTLTRETVTSAWASSFRKLQIPGQHTFLSGMPFDHARNTAVQHLLESGMDWLFQLDDDVICPPDTIYRLLAHRQPIISGLYYRRNEPICPVMLKGLQWITSYPENATISVDYVGAGCLLIHRSVFGVIPYPWFDWRVDHMHLPQEQRLSEDFSFCQSAREKGLNILVDTSIKCKHCGLSEVTEPGKIKPLLP